MPKICEITQKKTITGRSRSHANNLTSRKFIPNLQYKTYFLPSLGCKVLFRLSSAAMRNIKKHGIEEVVRTAYKKGTLDSRWHSLAKAL